jgi:hypothetical protein
LPSDWPTIKRLALQPWLAGDPAGVVPVVDGQFDLELGPGQAVWLTPA